MLYEPAVSDTPATNLRALLPETVRRLDRAAVRQVADAVAATRVDPSLIADELHAPKAAIADQHRLWRQLMRVASQERDRLHARADAFQRFSERYFNQVPGRARDEVLIEQLAIEAPNIWSSWLDRAAVEADFLDFEAYRERHIGREAEHIAQIRVCLFAAENLARDALSRAHPDDAPIIARSFLADDALPYDLASSADEAEIGWLALRAVAPLLQCVLETKRGGVATRWVTLSVRIALSTRTTVWAQRTALEILAHDPGSASELLESRLRRRQLERDDWFVQARAAQLLAERDPPRALEVFADLGELEGDAVPSAICDGLGAIALPASVDMLERFTRRETPRKVRWAAGRALARITVAGGEAGSAAAQKFAGLLLVERDAAVIESLASVLMGLLTTLAQTDAPAARRVGVAVRDALQRRLHSEPDSAIANAVTSLRHDLAAFVSTDTAAELRAKLEAMPLGASVRIPATVAREDLAFAMAGAARRGFGLYARTARNAWVVRRGERFRPRLWRLLHELRFPSPTKRQGYQHTRARIFDGPLRAHPERLGEVTPTTVPGERREVSREGGWGPYLPSVDDLLDAQLSRVPIEIATTAGITSLLPADKPLHRWRNYLAISWSYRKLDVLRLASLEGLDEQERSKFLEHMRKRFQTTVQFRPHFDDDAAPPGIRALVSRAHEQPLLPAQRRLALPEASPLVAAGLSLEHIARTVLDFATTASTQLFERGGVRVRDLALVLVFLLGSFLVRLLWVRTTLERSRNAIPLSVGGWGTRGKSGTERLKAAVFGGLGYDVFVKTTGCEAMFIHAPRRMEAREIFIYRPYDKASIWEQRDMLQLASHLESDVFLWECMALNPRYVSILQSQWMRDDLVTLTNAYPDHEDIQGPSGVDVATTIGEFIPRNGVALTSEREMLPVFEAIADQRNTELSIVGPERELAIPDDMLARFPYNEHPRNIALVAELGARLGIDREFAIFAMADHVVPDLGVLKEYPAVNILGRDIRFINGCSANERAGFMNNWTRMNLEDIGRRAGSTEQVFTVVNNRADRVPRSMVFADILVRDIAVDRHVLIGTNLSGLRIYLDESMDRYLANIRVAEARDPLADARRRLETFLARVRLRDAPAASLLAQLEAMARATGRDFHPATDDEATLEAALDELAKSFAGWDSGLHAARKHPAVRAFVDAIGAATPAEATALAPAAETEPTAQLVDFAHGEVADIEGFFAERVACVVAARHFRARLAAILGDAAGAAEPQLDALHTDLVRTWRERFWYTVVSLDDSDISGDGIIVRAAQAAPPGFDVALMGTQNIKGTGLDFVYRWVELHGVRRRVEALADAPEALFGAELLWLASSTGFHLTDALTAWRELRDIGSKRKCSPRELALVTRASSHLGQLALRRIAEASATSSAPTSEGPKTRILAALERFLDPLDAVWRRYRSDRLMRLLAARRVSHLRMASEMRDLMKRQKGGWLSKR